MLPPLLLHHVSGANLDLRDDAEKVAGDSMPDLPTIRRSESLTHERGRCAMFLAV